MRRAAIDCTTCQTYTTGRDGGAFIERSLSFALAATTTRAPAGPGVT
jgi:hypothetical protein